MPTVFHLTQSEFIVVLFFSNYLTIFCIVLYLHKYLSHKSIIPGKFLGHFCAFWLWITTGINSYVWATIHKDHHRYHDTDKDIHSILRLGFFTVLFKGIYIYFMEEKKILRLKPNYDGYSYLEKNVYFRYRKIGFLIFFIISSICFGVVNAIILLFVHTFFCLYLFANIFNAFAHKFGYRNFKEERLYSEDKVTTSYTTATNLFPWGFLMFGEELHNNHHTHPYRASNKVKWFEYDFGYTIFSILEKVKLLKIRKEDPVS